MERSTFILMLALGLISITGCNKATDPDQLINKPASIPDSLGLSDMQGQVVSSFINKKTQTMGVLYASGPALKSADIIAMDKKGKTLTLVTWRQQDDPHWFGARIPADLLSVERIMLSDSESAAELQYQKLAGSNLTGVADTTGRSKRIGFILSLKPSVIP
ncbi:hypothetical protein LZD49_34185 [Dyadobacter sp. CY261]|uniref:hypothetical protein n=1 Tax=Dyadobacter sp. CY261 TaxID=2907203 RepID=UPI001F34E756|nr:hypothetical protein [Dyadobacter sp. CY261]MCF0075573.1 hypothetical protein [Dyadobacter sp. CY261]